MGESGTCASVGFSQATKVDSMPKTEGVLLRLTKQDKAAIVSAASKLSLTVTEYLTKSVLMVAKKVGK